MGIVAVVIGVAVVLVACRLTWVATADEQLGAGR